MNKHLCKKTQHCWMYLSKGKRQCTVCDVMQQKDFGRWEYSDLEVYLDV